MGITILAGTDGSGSRVSRLGRVETGRRADLSLVKDNPRRIFALREISLCVEDGNRDPEG